MDGDSFKCCDGVPRELGNIPKDKAVCCGDSCIDGRDYWCCEGKAYWKGENNEEVGELIEGMNCNEFFKQSVLDRNAGRFGDEIVTLTSPTTVSAAPPTPPTTEAPAPPPRRRRGRGRGRGR